MNSKDEKDEFEKYLQKSFKVEITNYNKIEPIPYYSTGILSLDIASGIGGLPKGRIVEIYGPESSGKSLLALVAAAYAQKVYNKPSLYIDLEGATPPQWLQTLGLDLDMLTVIKAGPDVTAERVLDLLIEASNRNIYAYSIVDSVVGLVSSKEFEESIAKESMGVLSRILGRGLKVLVPALNQSETCAIFINQTREKIGVMYGDPETTPGGKALKFYASQRYRISKKSGSEEKNGTAVLGHTVAIKNKKNKLGPPQVEAELPINYLKGVNNIADLIKYGRLYRYIVQSGQFYDVFSSKEGQKIPVLHVRGLNNLADELICKPQLCETLYGVLIDEFLKGRGEFVVDTDDSGELSGGTVDVDKSTGEVKEF